MDYLSDVSPAMRSRLQAIPALNGFFEEVHSLVVDGCPDVSACQQTFDFLCSGFIITEVVNHELTRFAVEKGYLPDAAAEFSLTLFRTRACGLDLKVLSTAYTPDGRLHGLTDDILVSSCINSDVLLDTYKQPQLEPYEVFDRSRKLVSLGKRSLGSRSKLFRAGVDLFAFAPPTSDALLLFFNVPSRFRLRWEYDQSTLAPTRITAVDPASSRIEFACKTLATMQYKAAASTITELTTHPDHHVRWAAVTSLLELDFESGVHALKAACLDTHPHVREASAASLASLEHSSI